MIWYFRHVLLIVSERWASAGRAAPRDPMWKGRERYAFRSDVLDPYYACTEANRNLNLEI